MAARKPTPSRRPAAQVAKADGFERQDHGERTRERIIEAAIDLFAEHGYRGTGIAALAKKVGMSGPGLLYYFGTKERLLLEVMAERDRSELQHRQSRVRLRDLHRSGRRTVRAPQLTRLHAVLAAESISPEHPLHSFYVGRYRRQHRLARRVLEIEQAEGRVRRDIDVDQVAREMQAMALGLELMWLTDPDTFDFQGSIEQYYERLIADLAP
jgi:AcrR family transcriptional regulator